MKCNLLGWLRRSHVETLAVFGGARLVLRRDGRIELAGGTPDDHAAAREWCSFFLHEAVSAGTPRPPIAARRQFAGPIPP